MRMLNPGRSIPRTGPWRWVTSSAIVLGMLLASSDAAASFPYKAASDGYPYTPAGQNVSQRLACFMNLGDAHLLRSSATCTYSGSGPTWYVAFEEPYSTSARTFFAYVDISGSVDATFSASSFDKYGNYIDSATVVCSSSVTAYECYLGSFSMTAYTGGGIAVSTAFPGGLLWYTTSVGY
jgi:hypothetical protein